MESGNFYITDVDQSVAETFQICSDDAFNQLRNDIAGTLIISF